MNAHIDHHSFLVNNNLFTDGMKDSIAMAGHCIVEEIKDVNTVIDFNNKVVTYRLLLPSNLYKNLKLLENFEKGESMGFWKMRRLKKFLQKKREIEKQNEQTMGYRLNDIASKFIESYLNAEWSAKVDIFNAGNKDEIENFKLHDEANKSSN